ARFCAPWSAVRGAGALATPAFPTPMIGWSQSKALRRWSADARLWMVASALGWTGCAAVGVFGQHDLPDVDRLAGRVITAIAGFPVESSVGATLVGGAVAGTVTGLALSMVLRNRRLDGER